MSAALLAAAAGYFGPSMPMLRIGGEGPFHPNPLSEILGGLRPPMLGGGAPEPPRMVVRVMRMGGPEEEPSMGAPPANPLARLLDLGREPPPPPQRPENPFLRLLMGASHRPATFPPFLGRREEPEKKPEVLPGFPGRVLMSRPIVRVIKLGGDDNTPEPPNLLRSLLSAPTSPLGSLMGVGNGPLPGLPSFLSPRNPLATIMSAALAGKPGMTSGGITKVTRTPDGMTIVRRFSLPVRDEEDETENEEGEEEEKQEPQHILFRAAHDGAAPPQPVSRLAEIMKAMLERSSHEEEDEEDEEDEQEDELPARLHLVRDDGDSEQDAPASRAAAILERVHNARSPQMLVAQSDAGKEPTARHFPVRVRREDEATPSAQAQRRPQALKLALLEAVKKQQGAQAAEHKVVEAHAVAPSTEDEAIEVKKQIHGEMGKMKTMLHELFDATEEAKVRGISASLYVASDELRALASSNKTIALLPAALGGKLSTFLAEVARGLQGVERTLHLTTFADHYEVRGNYTGVKKSQLAVDLHERKLTVKVLAANATGMVEHGAEQAAANATYAKATATASHDEPPSYPIVLPRDIAPTRMKAKLHAGTLTITVPRVKDTQVSISDE